MKKEQSPKREYITKRRRNPILKPTFKVWDRSEYLDNSDMYTPGANR